VILARVVGKEEPITKEETVELLADDTTKGRTDQAARLGFLCQTPSKQVNIVHRNINITEFVPSV